MKIKKEYERWLANAVADTDVAAELKAMDYVEVEDAFYRDLAFGPGFSGISRLFEETL